MAEDRFANVFAAEVVLSAANTLTWAELNFGIQLRDRIGVVIDELLVWWSTAGISRMTTTGDSISIALSVSDQPTDFSTGDRRILYTTDIVRLDLGTAAGGVVIVEPTKQSFHPPLIVLPNRLFFGGSSVGLADPITLRMRLHFRTVSISQDRQLLEILESMQLST